MSFPPSCAAPPAASNSVAAPTIPIMFITIPQSSATLQCHKINALAERQCRQTQISMKHTGVGSKLQSVARAAHSIEMERFMTGFLRAAITGLVCLLGLAGGVAPASAADYPNRPVRWLIGITAGGRGDMGGRMRSEWLSEHFGQEFVVENRAGSGGNLAAAAAVN